MNCFEKLFGKKVPVESSNVTQLSPQTTLATMAPVPLQPKSMGKALMIDVSHYEPIPNYFKLKEAGVQAVYAKSSEHAADSLFKEHISAAQAAGLPCGGYHFFHGSVDGNRQSDLFLGVVRDVKLELKPCLDWESGSADKMSSSHQQMEADKWLSAVEKEKKRIPAIYGGEAFLRELNLPLKYARYSLWLAHYQTTEAKLRCPFPWSAYAAWQFTDAMRISGLTDGHSVDASYAYLDQFLV